MVGEDICNYIHALRARLRFLKQHCQWWTIDSTGTDDTPIQALFLEQNEVIATDPSFGLYAFIAEEKKGEQVHALVYPDRRGDGYGLTRYEDCQRLDFSKLENETDVRFAHKRGFVAKVDSTDPARLQDLIAAAVVDNTN